MTTLRLIGSVPPEVWNRLGTKVLPKLRSGDDLSVGIEFSVSVSSAFAMNMETELQQILADLGLSERRVGWSSLASLRRFGQTLRNRNDR